MRHDDFAESQRGHLVAIPGGVAFLPPPIPRDLRLPRELEALDRRVHNAVGALEAAASAFSVEQAVGPLRLREARLSNEIEGTHTRIEDVLSAVVARSSPSDDVAEVLATAEALDLGIRHLEDGVAFGEWLIRQLHQKVLGTGRGSERSPGEYRRRQVVIGRSGDDPETARFVPPPPEQVPPAMADLLEFAAEDTYGPVYDAAAFHYQFEALHPFEDGNGRLGRALIPLLWVRRGLLRRPLLYLGAWFAERRDEYFTRLLRVSTHNEWLEWFAFFGQGALAEAHATRQRFEEVSRLMADYGSRLRAHSKSPTARDALPLLLQFQVLTSRVVQEHTGSSRPAAAEALRILHEIGAVETMGRVSGAQAYVARELLMVLHGRTPPAKAET
ncbi:Fic family protein [Tepidiforma sp.]|uniref:Fic family protein n=1 Tax=Tepidiforma sp. TaxID=2682230 RepID=UPI002ADE25D1|nr:Fic family protein [Tepidiforma sp.]